MLAATSGATMRPTGILGNLNVRTFFCLRRFACLCAISDSPRKAGFQDAPAQILEVDAVAPGRHGHEAVTRHARYGVYLEHERLLVLAGHEVNAPPAGTSQFLEGRDGQLRVALLLVIGGAARADVLRAIRFVFRPVVI